MMKKVYIISFILLLVTVFSFLIFKGYIKLSWERGVTFGKYSCPYFIASGSQHGDIHMPKGTIFGYETKSGEKLYDIIRDDTFIFSAYFSNDFDKIFKCFRTEELAVKDGYKKFLNDQAAQKKRRLEAQEQLNPSQITGKLIKDYDLDPYSATDQAKLLQNIDSVIGL